MGITCPTADAQVVRRLLALIYSSTVALKALNLSLSELIDVLAQAAEWQCEGVVTALVTSLEQRLQCADVSLSIRVLQLASVRSDASNQKWNTLFNLAAERVAETCNGDFKILHDLSLN